MGEDTPATRPCLAGFLAGALGGDRSLRRLSLRGVEQAEAGVEWGGLSGVPAIVSSWYPVCKEMHTPGRFQSPRISSPTSVTLPTIEGGERSLACGQGGR